MSKYGRSRKEQNLDRKDKHEEFTEHVDSKAKKWMEHDAYKPWHKEELPKHTVISYMKSKGHDTRRVIADGQKDS